MSKTYKGIFKPMNPLKYKGDSSNIVYRSSWELKLMVYFDKHPDILQWSSEEIVIPYRSPIDGRVHRYFPDFWVKKRTRDGKIDQTLIEVKPLHQTREPKPQKRMTKKYLTEVKTWGINSSKWRAAEEFCKDRGWNWMIITEKELGLD
jgi:hypothetical protein